MFAKFIQNTKGAYTVVFAIIMVPVIGSVGIALDYANVYNYRQSMQQAVDISALAAAKKLAQVTIQNKQEKMEYLESYAYDFFIANLDKKILIPRESFGLDIKSNNNGNYLSITANYTYETLLAHVISIDKISMKVSGAVMANEKTVEVSLVIDNSTSMNCSSGEKNGKYCNEFGTDTRMEKAREAAKDFVNLLFNASSITNKLDPVKISIVPFGSSVNILWSTNKDYNFDSKSREFKRTEKSWYKIKDRKLMSWMDKDGQSKYHHENFQWDHPEAGYPGGAIKNGNGWKDKNGNPLTRFTLFKSINVSWRGCTEMRPGKLSTDDTPPVSSSPDTLFVPMFAPDEPDKVVEYYDGKKWAKIPSYIRKPGGSIYWNAEVYTKNNYLFDFEYQKNKNLQTINNTGQSKQQSRIPWISKYFAKSAKFQSPSTMIKGFPRKLYGYRSPNFSCTTSPMLPLTNNKKDIERAIEIMSPEGLTNIQAGLVWAWRSLSKNAPFVQGRQYTDLDNSKYIVLLSDGENDLSGQYYAAWGYLKNNRLRDTALRYGSKKKGLTSAMDQNTLTVCSNIKNKKITIFTIIYDVKEGSSVKKLAQSCASKDSKGNKYYYDVTGGDQLDTAMQKIANEIASIRISQ